MIPVLLLTIAQHGGLASLLLNLTLQRQRSIVAQSGNSFFSIKVEIESALKTLFHQQS